MLSLDGGQKVVPEPDYHLGSYRVGPIRLHLFSAFPERFRREVQGVADVLEGQFEVTPLDWFFFKEEKFSSKDVIWFQTSVGSFRVVKDGLLHHEQQ